ncbi:hypothetical protein SAMN02745220_03724 [Desulfopila aestuarii DSM 18488]|uniref:Uncharacterized protein n=1 Tax=Desulfopila aestuarii DSM 18488 TaxID=1121416 RepID=A0A1M7YEE0_9BACT|nr:hypothetical protein SAMN02745220_03724 [Desulfopila aestuarii DSM 18488]
MTWIQGEGQKRHYRKSTTIVVDAGWGTKKYRGFQVLSDITTKVVITTFVVGATDGGVRRCLYSLKLNDQSLTRDRGWLLDCFVVTAETGNLFLFVLFGKRLQSFAQRLLRDAEQRGGNRLVVVGANHCLFNEHAGGLFDAGEGLLGGKGHA